MFLLLAVFGCRANEGPCFGLELNHTYQVTVEDRYDPMSKFTYTKEIASEPLSSCGEQFRIAGGTVMAMKVFKQASEEGCTSSNATVEGLPNVTFTGDFASYVTLRIGAGLQAAAPASIGNCVGYLMFLFNAPHQQPETGNLYGVSQPGQEPAVVMLVGYTALPGPSSCTLTSCSDYYVVTVKP